MADAEEAPCTRLPASCYRSAVSLLFETSRRRSIMEESTFWALLKCAYGLLEIFRAPWYRCERKRRCGLILTSYPSYAGFHWRYCIWYRPPRNFSGSGLPYIATLQYSAAWNYEMWAFPPKGEVRGVKEDKKNVSCNCGIKNYDKESCGERSARIPCFGQRLRQKTQQ